MLVSHRIPVKLFGQGEHELVISFPSSYLMGKKIEREQLGRDLAENVDPKTGDRGVKLKSWNGDTGRLYVRKSQYGWGWDWGPVLMTVGP